MLRKSLLAALLCAILAPPALAQTHVDTGGTIIPGVSAGQVKEVCLTPAVTTAKATGRTMSSVAF